MQQKEKGTPPNRVYPVVDPGAPGKDMKERCVAQGRKKVGPALVRNPLKRAPVPPVKSKRTR